jgi:Bacterial translation initiation factor IF-2 associated region./Translation initiation factor IF-2, N-terminal region.
MAQTSVSQFASELKMPAASLLEQLAKAGVGKKGETDLLSDADKTKLLDYLRKSHGATESKSKITLTRKQTTEIKKSDASGKARTIQVEVRKKRVFVKRDETQPTEAAAPAQVAAPQPVVDAEQAKLREMESQKQSELLARQAAELKEKQEREVKARQEAEERQAAQQAAVEAEKGKGAGSCCARHHRHAAQAGRQAGQEGREAEEGNDGLEGRGRQEARHQDPRRYGRRFGLAWRQGWRSPPPSAPGGACPGADAGRADRA